MGVQGAGQEYGDPVRYRTEFPDAGMLMTGALASMPIAHAVSAVFTYCKREKLVFYEDCEKPRKSKKEITKCYQLFLFFSIFANFVLPSTVNSSAKENTFSFKRKKVWKQEEFLKFLKLFSHDANEFPRQFGQFHLYVETVFSLNIVK
jgi:hypothetical protein